MSAQIISFPRRKPLAWDELPAYWSYADRSYYEMSIKDGMRPEDAFREHDLRARAPSPAAGLRLRQETDEEYIARLEAIAMPAAQAEACGRRA